MNKLKSGFKNCQKLTKRNHSTERSYSMSIVFYVTLVANVQSHEFCSGTVISRTRGH